MKVSTSWSEFTIEQFQRYYEFSKVTIANEIERKCNILAIMANVPVEEIYKLDINTANELLSKCGFVNTKMPDGFVNMVKIGREVYNVNPDLSQYEFGMYMDYTALLKEGSIENLHKLISMFIRKDGEKYDSDVFMKRAELIRTEVTMDVAWGIASFFLTFWQNVQGPILDQMNQKVKQLMKEAFSLVGTGGSGWTGSIKSTEVPSTK